LRGDKTQIFIAVTTIMICGVKNMSKSHEWIEKERETLRKKYPNKVILVRECEVIKVFDIHVSVRDVFDEADKLCKGKDWAWADLPAEECELILWL